MPSSIADKPLPTLFALHFLGGSKEEWRHVSVGLADRITVRALDLPGFGSAAHVSGYTVDEMAEGVAQAVRSFAPRRWFLAGHSMGAKVAAAVARRAVDGEMGLEGLAGIVLLAGSPPSPEPMSEARREDMTRWLDGDHSQRLAKARDYIGGNAVSLGRSDRDAAEADVLRANPAAWRAWLQSGSREDWSSRIGLLPLPALILAGAEDADLGPEAQQRMMAPHYAEAEFHTIIGAKHLLPLEASAEVARLIADFIQGPHSYGDGVTP